MRYEMMAHVNTHGNKEEQYKPRITEAYLKNIARERGEVCCQVCHSFHHSLCTGCGASLTRYESIRF